MRDNASFRIHRPALDFYFQRNLKNNQMLVFNLVTTYNKDESRRLDQESRKKVLLTDVNSRVSEAIYEKKLTNANHLSFGVRHTQSFSDNAYHNEQISKTRMNQAESFIYGEFKGKVRQLDYTVDIGVTRSSYNQEDTNDTYQYHSFNPRVVLHYHLPRQSFICLKGRIDNASPSLSSLNAVNQIIGSLQIQRGNPHLKSYLCFSTKLMYEYQKGIFYGNLSGTYQYQPNAIMDEKFQEGNKIVQTWNNQRDWQQLAGQTTFRVGPIKDLLQVSVTGGGNHYISHGNTYSHTYTNWFVQAQASFTYKKYSLIYESTPKSLTFLNPPLFCKLFTKADIDYQLFAK